MGEAVQQLLLDRTKHQLERAKAQALNLTAWPVMQQQQTAGRPLSSALLVLRSSADFPAMLQYCRRLRLAVQRLETPGSVAPTPADVQCLEQAVLCLHAYALHMVVNDYMHHDDAPHAKMAVLETLSAGHSLEHMRSVHSRARVMVCVSLRFILFLACLLLMLMLLMVLLILNRSSSYSLTAQFHTNRNPGALPDCVRLGLSFLEEACNHMAGAANAGGLDVAADEAAADEAAAYEAAADEDMFDHGCQASTPASVRAVSSLTHTKPPS